MTEHDDNNDLHDLDLHAWQVPAPPNGLADAVIARATATDEAIAVAKRGQQRRTYATAAIACGGSVAAALAVWLAVRPAPAREIDMTVIAAAPQHVAVGDTTVDLASGATIQTERRGDALHVVQSGTATWHVDAKDNLEIDAGSSGAIEATGASLRVEATMNTQQALLVGGGVLSAAAIALVTATVYEGRVTTNASEGHVVAYLGMKRTTTADLGPGSVVTIGSVDAVLGQVRQLRDVSIQLGGHAPEPLAVKGLADIAIRPGVSATIWVAEPAQPYVDVEIQSACQLRVEVDGKRGLPVMVGTSDGGVFDATLTVGKYTYDATCTGQAPIHGALDVRAESCRRAACGADRERMLTITSPALGAHFGPPSVHVVGTTIDPESITLSIGADVITPAPSGDFAVDLDVATNESIALRIDHPRLGTQFFVQHSIAGGAATVKKAPPPKPAPACDEMTCQSDGYSGACCSKLTKPDPKTCKADKLIQAGTNASAQSNNAEALKQFAAAYACKPDGHVLSLTFMSACNGGDVKAARLWWRKLSSDEQTRDLVICIRAHITRDQLDAP
ncbi:MAG TPA: hypothetical protein VH143_29745 [Kofleriaceae bacterium]|jgi:hypothetical protein|nr:hypothetical protein [Kofleriaceae bacterium]